MSDPDALEALAVGEPRRLTEADIGKMFHVPWSPNPHRLEEIRPRYYQLHGEFIWFEACLRKKRNSKTRPWGSISATRADNPEIIPWEQALASQQRNDGAGG